MCVVVHEKEAEMFNKAKKIILSLIVSSFACFIYAMPLEPIEVQEHPLPENWKVSLGGKVWRSGKMKHFDTAKEYEEFFKVKAPKDFDWNSRHMLLIVVSGKKNELKDFVVEKAGVQHCKGNRENLIIYVTILCHRNPDKAKSSEYKHLGKIISYSSENHSLYDILKVSKQIHE